MNREEAKLWIQEDGQLWILFNELMTVTAKDGKEVEEVDTVIATEHRLEFFKSHNHGQGLTADKTPTDEGEPRLVESFDSDGEFEEQLNRMEEFAAIGNWTDGEADEIPYLVKKEYACPKCGEQQEDSLGIDGDGIVVCASCGHVYDLEPHMRTPGYIDSINALVTKMEAALTKEEIMLLSDLVENDSMSATITSILLKRVAPELF